MDTFRGRKITGFKFRDKTLTFPYEMERLIGKQGEIIGFDGDLDAFEVLFEIEGSTEMWSFPKKQVIERLEGRDVYISLSQARTLYKTDPYLRSSILKGFSDDELEVPMKTWEELEKVSGFEIDSNSRIMGCAKVETALGYKAIFATQAQAKSALAMAQLSQLMADLGGECEIDWGKEGSKHVIKASADRAYGATSLHSKEFLAFNTRAVRDRFLEAHRDLINQYFGL